MLKRCQVGLVALVVGFLLSPSASAADSFAGTYTGEKLSVELTPDGGSYAGKIRIGDKQYPLKATPGGAGLKGQFTDGGDSFAFTVQTHGDGLTFETDGSSYTLHRVVQPVNPLARGAQAGPANPLAHGATQPAAGNAPAGYTVVNKTDFGQALSTQKPKTASTQAALEATLPDLARYFDGKPTVVSAFEDSKDHGSGGASFTAKLGGKPVRGFISCKLGDDAAKIAVIYLRTDAPKGEWEKLTVAAPIPGAPPAETEVALQTYKFPDGTGSIGIANGYKTNSQSCAQTVTVQGPADQMLGIGVTYSVVTPDSTAVQLQRQLELQARQLGSPPPPPMQLLVAPFTGPVDAIVNLVPQLSRMSERGGGPAFRLDKINSQREVKANLTNGKAAIIRYTYTRATKGTPVVFRGLAQIETAPIANGSWMYYSIAITAPDATFDRDEPVMMAMLNSLKTNDAAIQQRTRENIDASNRRFEAMQAAHREQVAAYDDYNKAWARRSNEQSRSNANFDEVIRGYRTVEDTQTGQRSSVDLGNVDDVVDTLNQHEPGRYKQIPLRDEVYPVQK